MKSINQDGYYISEPFFWTEMHAGVKFEGSTYYFLKFDDEKCFIDSGSSPDEINVENLLKKKNYGTYEIDDYILQVTYNPQSLYRITRTFTIISSERLLDENLKEYKHVK